MTNEPTDAAATAAAAAAAAASAAEDCPRDELAVGIDRRDMELHDEENQSTMTNETREAPLEGLRPNSMNGSERRGRATSNRSTN